MIRKSPLNYLITIALGAILWVATAVFYGGSFSETLMLAVSTPEEFLSNFRTMMGVAAGLGIIFCLYWYFYGSRDKTAGDLGKAKKIWWGSFLLLIIISVAILLGLVFMNLKEGILTTDWLISYALFSLHTWFFFWICSFIMSPRAVINIPLFK